MLSEFAYIRARSVKEALDNLKGEGARVHAGGTDLLGCLHDHVFGADKVVSISGLKELEGIRETPDGGLSIGALTTITDVATSPVVRKRFPGLAQAAADVASPQLRNQGTLGGNLCQRPRCWYFRGEFHCLKKGGDTCYAESGENRYHAIFGGTPCYIVHPSDTAPMLMAMGASVRIAGPRGNRVIRLDDFFVLPEVDVTRENTLGDGELVTEIMIPASATGLKTSYRKVRERGAWDFALASVALALRIDGGRVEHSSIVLGGVAPIPWRSSRAEEALTGQGIDEAVARSVAEAAVAKADPLEQNAYKISLVRGIVTESLMAMA